MNERREAEVDNAVAVSGISFEGADMPELLSAFERLKEAIIKAKANGGGAVDTDVLFGLRWKVSGAIPAEILAGSSNLKFKFAGRLRGPEGRARVPAAAVRAGTAAGASATVAPLALRSRSGTGRLDRMSHWRN